MKWSSDEDTWHPSPKGLNRHSSAQRCSMWHVGKGHWDLRCYQVSMCRSRGKKADLPVWYWKNRRTAGGTHR